MMTRDEMINKLERILLDWLLDRNIGRANIKTAKQIATDFFETVEEHVDENWIESMRNRK